MKLFLSLMVLVIFSSCDDEENDVQNNTNALGDTNSKSVLEQLGSEYEQLPERGIAASKDNTVFAQYALPTDRYGHGILGDRIEAGQLVVAKDSVFYVFTLSDDYVFEDIKPRLFDVDRDGELEFVTIRSHKDKGAGVVIYKIILDQLEEYAWVNEIGTSFRWLNIVAINDLDNNGKVELVWVQTPHIGGVLKVATIGSGELSVIDETRQFSNHAIGERNLCLSVLTGNSRAKVFYLPTQNRNHVRGFSFKDDKLLSVVNIDLKVDFSRPLSDQHEFKEEISSGNNCTCINERI